jgi:hypothetical protein
MDGRPKAGNHLSGPIKKLHLHHVFAKLKLPSWLDPLTEPDFLLALAHSLFL